MKRGYWVLLAVLILAFGCASDERHRLSKGKLVKIVPEVASSCKSMGEVYASAAGEGEELKRIVHYSRNMLRNQTAYKGGDSVVIQTNNMSNDSGKFFMVLSGMAYKCSRSYVKPVAKKVEKKPVAKKVAKKPIAKKVEKKKKK